jgi:tetratricopeptide (TPR) repeat protein
MLISNMNDSERQQFEEAYALYLSGKRGEASKELEALARSTAYPADRIGILCQLASWSLDAGDLVGARKVFNELNEIIRSLFPTAPDSKQDDLAANLTIRAKFVEARLLNEEGGREQASKILDELVARYPGQLSLEYFAEIFNHVQLLRGIFKADKGEWSEAGPLLEQTVPPNGLEGLRDFYIGNYHFTKKAYTQARRELTASLASGLPIHLEEQARYLLGISEYYLSDFVAAKRELEHCVQISTPEYLGTTKVWEWLAAVSSALGMTAEAESYRKRTVMPRDAKVS